MRLIKKVAKVRACRHCLQSFSITNGNQLYCCPACKEAYLLAHPVVWKPRKRNRAPSAADTREQDRQDAISEIRYVIRSALDLGTSGPCVSLKGQPHYGDLVDKYQRGVGA